MGMAQGVSPAMQSSSNCGAHALPHGVGHGARWCGQPAPGAMAHGVSPAMQSGSNCEAHALSDGLGHGARWCGRLAFSIARRCVCV